MVPWTVAIIIPFGLENYSELSQLVSNSCEAELHGPLARLSASYYKLLQELTPFDATPTHVKIVSVDATVEGGWVANPCDMRTFTGHLVQVIAAERPAAIVIDWSNAPDSCLQVSTNTTYQNSILTAAQSVPVVFARTTMNMESLERTDPARFRRLPADGRSGDHFIAEADLFDSTPGAVTFGLSRLNCDVRKIPLRWWTYPEKPESGELAATLTNALPLAAVTQANYADVLATPRIHALIGENRHPFSQFLAGFETLHAIDLLCEQRPSAYTPTAACASGASREERLHHLRSKVVLIADTTGENDFHQTPIGLVSGAVLHANYIESLITGRFWKPANLGFQLVVSLCWFAVVEILFENHGSKPVTALAYALGITLLFGFVLYYLLVMLLGYYFVLLPPSLILIAIRTTQLLTHPPAQDGHPKPADGTGNADSPQSLADDGAAAISAKEQR
jgi:hypothetical protein